MDSPASKRIALAFAAFWMLLLSCSIPFKLSARFLGWPRWEDYVIEENRVLTPPPDLRALPVRDWGRAVETWYNDLFAWRSRLIQFYRWVHIALLHSAINDTEVPGRGGWIFRRGGSWAELEDYLGAFELTPGETARWVEFFEGRRAWAAAHGAAYLEVITPVKAQIHPDMLFPAIARHRGRSVRGQVEAALAGSPARTNVLFVTGEIERITRENRRPFFYATDHHVNGFGCYTIYAAVVDAASRILGVPMSMPPWYGADPPPAVRDNLQWGCFQCGPEGYERLCVRMPGMVRSATSLTSKRGPEHMIPLAFDYPPGARRTLAIAHDSFLRYPLQSWYHSDTEPVRVPSGDGFDRVLSLIFWRFKTHELDRLVAAERPDLIVEQFPEIKLTQDVVGYDETMRRAAAWGRGTPVTAEEALALPPGTPLLACATLENATDPSGEWTDMRNGEGVPGLTVELLSGGDLLASLPVFPGPLRAVFFPALPLGGRPATLHVADGSASSATLAFRLPAPPGD